MDDLSRDEIAEIMSKQEKWVDEAVKEWTAKFVESGDATFVTGSLAIHLEHSDHYSRSNMAELVAIAVAAVAKARMQ